MNKKLENTLRDKYPDLYPDSLKTDSGGIIPLYFGLDCDDGWFNILDNAFRELSELFATLPLEKKPTLFQVKEKLGGLRIYLTHFPPVDLYDVYDKVILKYESQSYKTCELCGTNGKLCVKSEPYAWLKTLCNDCANIQGFIEYKRPEPFTQSE